MIARLLRRQLLQPVRLFTFNNAELEGTVDNDKEGELVAKKGEVGIWRLDGKVRHAGAIQQKAGLSLVIGFDKKRAYTLSLDKYSLE